MIDKTLRKKKARRVRKSFCYAGKLRLTIYRSSKHIFAQIIDDEKKRTLVSASDMEGEVKKTKKGLKKTETAQKVGELLAQKASRAKISKVVFDRGYLRYHGRIKALAEGARAAGLKF